MSGFDCLSLLLKRSCSARSLRLGSRAFAPGLAMLITFAATAVPRVLAGDASSQVRHWAFETPSEPPVPEVRNQRWARNPVDRFVLARLEGAGLVPSPQADRRTLLRRLSHTLRGLPPTQTELDRFLSDGSPEAWSRQVDSYLMSAQYGERWGRHWLDAARFADTKGYVYSDREETRFVHSYLYRDWVVQALNRDMPYDRFLKLQLAADQLDTSREDLAALGFLTLGRRFLGVAHDIIDDRIDTVTRATQGLTVSCARCHDHKFDPIPIQDYYSLYGVFAASYEKLTPLDPSRESDPKLKEFFATLRQKETKLQETFERRRNEAGERFRRQVGMYLEAVLEVEKLPTEEFYEIRLDEELNPVIVRQWHAYLQRRFQTADPVFLPWRELSRIGPSDFNSSAASLLQSMRSAADQPAHPTVISALLRTNLVSMKDVARVYSDLLLEVRQKWIDTVAKATNGPTPGSLPERFSDPLEESLREVLYGSDSPARVPGGSINEIEWFFGESVRVELAKLYKDIEAHLINSPGAAPFVVGLEDRASAPKPRVFKRGNPASRGDEVPRQFLEVIAGEKRKPFSKGSGRAELAEVIATPSNPLTARVMVNRIWMHHFGQALVATPSDFGLRADAPSHPELLDWLAVRFMREGWSMKAIHRLILNSAAWMQRSDALPGLEAQALRVDPENRLLWRANRQRMDFEAMRDALLAATGELELSQGGRSVSLFDAPYSKRRSLYGYVDRQFVPGVLRVFDMANPDMHSPKRAQTTVPQQALFFMNNRFIHERSQAAAAHCDSRNLDAGIDALYRQTLLRRPTSEERVAASEFLLTAPPPAPPPYRPPGAETWTYGWGSLATNKQAVRKFHLLPHFNGDAWQGGEKWPDSVLGWAQLTAMGGHAGNDLDHAVIRRWTAPAAGTYRVTGELSHEHKQGDGIRAYVIQGQAGLLKDWAVHNRKQETGIAEVRLEKGEALDFVVDFGGGLAYDDFKWAPVIEVLPVAEPVQGSGSVGAEMKKPVSRWDAKECFAGPSENRLALGPWAQLAQVLLLSNEFLFVD